MKQKLKDMIIKNLRQNGFPQKRVSLPTDKLFGIADNYGISFNSVLEDLKELGIMGEVGADKVIFAQINKAEDHPQFTEEMISKAQEMMANLSQEQRDDLMKKYQSMSEEERNKIIEQGKKMGLF